MPSRMDSSGRTRLGRPGSRLRRQRSQEWHGYSSSDNDDTPPPAYRHAEPGQEAGRGGGKAGGNGRGGLEMRGYGPGNPPPYASLQRDGARLYLSLRRGASSSSTSDNNSGTDSEPAGSRRPRSKSDCQNMFRDSPPEPAPPPSENALGRRGPPRYVETEGEPPYMPNVVSASISPYDTHEIVNNGGSGIKVCSSDTNMLSKPREERIYSQPSPPSGGKGAADPYCPSPGSTTGPMVPPVANCVAPQLIQSAAAPPPARKPPRAFAFASSISSSSRLHFQKTCGHRCSWKLATFVLIVLAVVLTAFMAYLAAMSSLSVPPESSKACVLMDDQDSKENALVTTLEPPTKGSGALPQPACLVALTDTNYYKKAELGATLRHALQAHDTWNLWFAQPYPGFVRFNLTLALPGSRLALLARRNEPPSLTAYDIMEVVAEEHRVYRRAAPLQQDTVHFLHYLEAGTWYVSLLNDDVKPVHLTFVPSVASDIPISCPNDCHEHGSCHLGKCHCFPGYIGPDCADSVCPVLCTSHGRYVHGACRCEPGWKGPECNVPSADCEVPDCGGHGRCHDGACLCEAGFKGRYCDEVDCVDPVCSHHGACVNGHCWCKIGWRGGNCSEPDDRLNRCFPDCSSHGVFDLETERCVCFDHWTGDNCSKAKCTLDCGSHGSCEEGQCQCEAGWGGVHCGMRDCDTRCLAHGQCNNGTCVCIQGWMGRHCSLDGCPEGCSSQGQCLKGEGDTWACQCSEAWGGPDCSVPQEAICDDDIDNDEDGLTDCADSECCLKENCRDSLMCVSSPDPLDILLRKQPPAVTASFYQKLKFLIEEQSVQSYAHRDEYSESQFWSAFVKSQVSVIRGRVVSREGNGLIGIRVSVATDRQFGFTLTRQDGWFDILVNGGGAITLQFQRNPFHPIKRTVLVPWNVISVMEAVVMSARPTVGPTSSDDRQAPCLAHDYDLMKPIVYQTWKPGSLGGCPGSSAVLVETQVVQEMFPIPGSELALVYASSHAAGYLSTIHLQLTPMPTVPASLRLVHLRIAVEGILHERTFEADPGIKYTFAWNKRNVYKQKVYGLTTARVYVGYEYTTCDKTVWTVQATSLRGFDMDISELGSWNLNIHHRYNFHEGVLQKGDGETIYFRQQPRVTKVLMGKGEQRPLVCPDCNGQARDSRLLSPVALTSGPDGSVYVGDLDLVRRITPAGQVYTVFKMKSSEVSNQYHLSLSPTDGTLYISDPERYKILRVHTLDKVREPEKNSEDVVGSGERCLPRDKDKCGDGRPALEARLSYPKGMAVAVDNTLYFADGPNIRMVDSRGIIDTLIGDHHHKKQWRPLPCSGTLPVDEVMLRWPTELSINPLDGCLYFVDDHMVLRVTKDRRVMVVAGQPAYCKLQPATKSRKAAGATAQLGALVSFTFGPAGEMYIAEVDRNNVHRVQQIMPDGEILHFAGADCECDTRNCTCGATPPHGESALARDTKLYAVSSLTVTSDGVVHVADQGSLKILSAIPYLPQPDDQIEFQIASPESHEIYVFNKYGQHIMTKSILTGKTIYTFLYNVNTSFGKLNAVTDASGNKVAFLRDSGNRVHTIETARGHKCRVAVTTQGLLETLTDPDQLTTRLEYDAGGLLTSRADAAGRATFYLYDENGRLTDLVRASGRVTSLTFDLGPEGATVQAREDGSVPVLLVTVRGSAAISRQGGMRHEARLHPDGALELESPWGQAVVWEAGPHPVLQAVLPLQAGMFPLPLRQTSFRGLEPVSNLGWAYGVRLGRPEADRPPQVAAVERVLSVNGGQYLTMEYDWLAAREILYNSSRRPFLVVQYDGFGRPSQWLPTETRLTLNLIYDRLGRLSGWQHGPRAEAFHYDRLGHLAEVRPGTSPTEPALKFAYDGKTLPSKVILPSGRKFTYHYDDNGGLKYVTNPKGYKHSFLILISIGFYKLFYMAPGNVGAYVVHFNDHKLPTMKIFPGDQGRILYRYTNDSTLGSIVYGGGSVRRTYHSTGLVAAEIGSRDALEVHTEYQYDGSAVSHLKVEYTSAMLMLTSASFHFQYDKMQRMRTMVTRIGTLQLPVLECHYNSKTGHIEKIGNFKVVERNGNETIYSDGTASFTKHMDALHRLRLTSLTMNDREVFRMDLEYDGKNSIIQSKIYTTHLGSSKMRLQNFSYDDDGQLIEMIGRDQWKFSYDPNGNLMTIQYMGNKIDILHDVGDRIVSFGETPYVVDGRGFIIQRGEEHFIYNTRGELIKASKNERYEVDYFYNGKGLLSVRKDNFGNLTQFLYGNPSKPHLVTHIYNNADGKVFQFLYDDRDFLIYLVVNKEQYYVTTDQNGSPLLLLDKKGDSAKEIHRGPYGHILFDSNPSFYLPVDFHGGLIDPLTNMIHFGSRIYDSLVGQWLTPRWDQVVKDAMDPMNLHLYRFNKNDPINGNKGKTNKMDLAEWIRDQGIEIDSLDMGAVKIFTAQDRNKPNPLSLELPSVSLASSFTCAIRKKLQSFSSLASVKRPKVKKEQLFESMVPKLSTQSVPFGVGITVSRMGHRAIVRSTNDADSIRRGVFTSVFNNSFILDLHLVMHGQDVFYFVKDSTWRFGEDLTQLQRLGNSINTTYHESKMEDQQSGHYMDIRVHAEYAILNIRYGTTLQKERQRLLRHAKKHAVGQRWAQERETILTNQRGSQDWSEPEREHILTSSSVPGYRGDYYHNVVLYPELADDPANIVFHKSSPTR